MCNVPSKYSTYLCIIHIFQYSIDESSEYVFNPINAFHLLKRLSIWIPKLKSKIPKLKFIYNARSLFDDYKIALYGIVDLQEYYDLNITDLGNGIIEDMRTGKLYKSNSHLTLDELVEISDEAKNAEYFDNHVDWLTSILERAIIENRPTRYITKLRYF